MADLGHSYALLSDNLLPGIQIQSESSEGGWIVSLHDWMSGQSTLEYTFAGSASYYLLFEGIRRFLEIDWELLEVYKGNERLKIEDERSRG